MSEKRNVSLAAPDSEDVSASDKTAFPEQAERNSVRRLLAARRSWLSGSVEAYEHPRHEPLKYEHLDYGMTRWKAVNADVTAEFAAGFHQEEAVQGIHESSSDVSAAEALNAAVASPAAADLSSTALFLSTPEAELELLKWRYILPFAASCRGWSPQALVTDADVDAQPLRPWQLLSDHLHGDPWQVKSLPDVPEYLLDEAKSHLITATAKDVQVDARRFIENRLPLELLTAHRESELLATARLIPQSLDVAQLVGLFAHLVYWSVIGPYHPPERRLPAASRQSMLAKIPELWSAIVAPHLGTEAGVGFVLPVLVLSIKHLVEKIFTSRYPRTFSRSTLPPSEVRSKADPLAPLGRHLVDCINLTCMHFLDPDCCYVRFGLLEATPVGQRLCKRLDRLLTARGHGGVNRTLVRTHRITPKVQSLLSGVVCPADAKTRIFLGKSGSEGSLRSRPGSAGVARHSAAQRKVVATKLRPSSPRGEGSLRRPISAAAARRGTSSSRPRAATTASNALVAVAG
jgi:hypothetical protein